MEAATAAETWSLLGLVLDGWEAGSLGSGTQLLEQPELKLLLQELRMIQNVIYRRKAESLAPGRGLLLNYILGGAGVEVCVGL